MTTRNMEILNRISYASYLQRTGGSEEEIPMWKVNGRHTTDVKWWQKLTLPVERWANNDQMTNYQYLIVSVMNISVTLSWGYFGYKFRARSIIMKIHQIRRIFQKVGKNKMKKIPHCGNNSKIKHQNRILSNL